MNGRISRWRGVAVLATLAAAATVPFGPAGQASAAGGRCAPGSGVTVVVDYGPIGGGVVIGCAPDGGGKSAVQVVKAAGFSLQAVNNQPGFVCRVNGQPGDTGEWAEDCGDTPPPDAYWGLFYSDADPATWTYSGEGVASLDVPEGGSIGWRFQDGGGRENPSQPPTAAKKSPSPQPSADPGPEPSKPPKANDPSPTPASTPSATVPQGAGDSGSSPAPEAQPGGAGEKTPGKPGKGKGTKDGNGDKGAGKEGAADKGKNQKARPADEAKGGETPVPSESPTVAMLEPTSDEPSTGGSSAVLTLVAGGAVLLLVGAAGVIAWRRRA